MSIEDIVLVQQLVCREREARDRQWWDEMRSIYAKDSWVDLSWYRGPGARFVDESIQLSKRGTSAKHRLGPVVVRLNKGGDRALATVAASIEMRFTVDEAEIDLSTDTRLIYRAVKSGCGGRWQVVSLHCIYECDRITPTIPGHSVKINPDELRPFRSSYKSLSYFLTQKGLPVNHDLPGDDRPETVSKIYDDSFAWLSQLDSEVHRSKEETNGTA